MIELRPFQKLGGADHGWLKAKHHFSFGSHYDPEQMGQGSLRVWNDDEIAPNTGFPAHPHANMEIITYVREGAITHQDSLGNKGRTEAGDVQVMSAGTRHPSLRIQSGADDDQDLPDLDRADHAGRPADLGREAVPEGGSFRQARDDRERLRRRQGRAADPRRCARARHHAEGRRERGICARQDAQPLSGAGGGQRSRSTACASTPATAPRSATRRKLKITALEDSELVLVDAA